MSAVDAQRSAASQAMASSWAASQALANLVEQACKSLTAANSAAQVKEVLQVVADVLLDKGWRERSTAPEPLALQLAVLKQALHGFKEGQEAKAVIESLFWRHFPCLADALLTGRR